MTNENFGGLGFKVGGGWPAFTGNVDDLTLGIGATTTTFDFDPKQEDKQRGGGAPHAAGQVTPVPARPQ